MSANQDDIRVRIAGDLADINKSLQELKRETKAAGAAARNTRPDWKGLGTQLTSLKNRVVGMAAGFLGLRALIGQIGTGLRDLQEVDRQSRALGTTAESYQKLLFTFRQFNLEQQDVSDALGTLADRARDAEDGTKSFIDDFRLLGVEVSDLRGKKPDELFRLIAERVASIEDPGRRTTGLLRIFGDELGRRLGPLLIGGAAALDEWGRKAEQAGAVVEDGLVAKASDAASAVARLNAEIAADRSRIIAENADAIRLYASAVEELKGAAAGFLVAVGKNLGEGVARLTGAEIPLEQQTLEELEKRLRVLRSFVENQPKLTAGGRPFVTPVVQDALDQIKVLERLIALEKERTRVREERRKREAAGQTGPGAAAAPEIVDRTPALKALQADLARAGTLLKDRLARLQADLDAAFQDNLVSFRDYFQKRADLERQAIDQQIEAQRAALSLVDEQIRLARARGDSSEAILEQEQKRAKIVADITVLERQRGDVAVRAARQQALAERDLNDQLAGVRERLLEIQGHGAAARESAVEREFRDLLKRLEAEGDTEGEELVRRLINVELARARLQEIEDQYNRTLANLTRQEQSIQAQVDTGVISERQGRREIIDLYQQTADQVEDLIPLMRELAEATGDPAAVERVKDLEAELERLRNTADRTIPEFKESVRDAGEDAFASFIKSAQDARDAWDSFVDRVKDRAAELLSEAVFDQLGSFFKGIFGGGGGGLAGAASTIGNFLAGIFHEGGIAGQARSLRAVPKLAFAGAPRLHSGGLLPDERPAILRVGEEVLTRRDPRHRDNFRMAGVTVNIQARDAESFRRQSPGQIAADVATALQRAANRNR